MGRTLQFQVGDARAADAALRRLPADVARQSAPLPAAASRCACNGRGVSMFGEPHHDARTTRELLRAPPLA